MKPKQKIDPESLELSRNPQLMHMLAQSRKDIKAGRLHKLRDVL